MKEFLEKTDLKNIMTVKHTGLHLPSTYTRGPNCLDLMAMSKTISDKAVIACGMLPFYHGMPSDHRALYVDLDIDYLFTNAYVNTGQSAYKRFTTNQTKKCDKYLYLLENYLEENRIITKVKELERKMHKYIDDEEFLGPTVGMHEN